MDTTPTPDGPPSLTPPTAAPTAPADGHPRRAARVSRRAAGIGAAALAVTGALTGWFAATATDDGTASTTVENQVSTVDPSSDIPTDQGPVFGDQEPTSPSDDGNYSGGAPDTNSGAS